MADGTTLTRARELGARRPLALVASGVLLYSTGPVIVQATDVSGPVLSFWRLWMGVALFGVLTAVHVGVTGVRPDRRAWRWSAFAGLAFGGHQLLFMSAVKATSVVDVTLMQVLAPVAVAALAVPLFGERPGRPFRAWSAVAILGAAVVVLAGASGPEGDPGGMALAVGNVLLFAVFFVWSKQGRDLIDVVPYLFGVMAAAAVAVSAYVLLAGEAVGSAAGGDLALAAALATGPGALGHFVSTWPLRWVPANIPPLLHLAIPFLSGAMAFAILGEGINAGHVLGGAVTIAGVAGAVRSPSGRRLMEREKPATPPASP